MNIDHMAHFDQIAEKILRYLYQEFPATAHPEPHTIGLTTESPGPGKDRTGQSQSWDSQIWDSQSDDVSRTLSWLIEEGLVQDHGYKTGPSYVLSAAGFKALSKIAPECRPPILLS